MENRHLLKYKKELATQILFDFEAIENVNQTQFALLSQRE